MEEFVAAFPAFDDRFDFKDGDIGEVCLFKKLQLLLSELYVAFEVRFVCFALRKFFSCSNVIEYHRASTPTGFIRQYTRT